MLFGGKLLRQCSDVQVGDHDVGDPVVHATPPYSRTATGAAFTLVFNSDGTINQALSESPEITNWSPLDVNGTPNGADGPLNLSDFPEGATTGVFYAPQNSNFSLELTGMTLLYRGFEVIALQQNGFSTGRATSLNVDSCGMIVTSFSNGIDLLVGHVALASFASPDGLLLNENGLHEETEASGTASFGAPCIDNNSIDGDGLQF